MQGFFVTDERLIAVTMKEEAQGVRLDKWLWAARFYRTRSLAIAAINGGKIHLNGVRAKPSKAVKLGDRLRIRRALTEMVVVVTAISAQRGSASIAQTLYSETAESVAERERQQALRKLSAPPGGFSSHRPDKRERRKIIRFIGK